MTGAKEFGVFLPVANGGWIVSTATPALDGSWAQNRDAALIAEEQGFDFVMAMGKWRGFGGATGHWDRSLEPLTLLAGLAAITKRVKLWTTLHPILHNPAVAAKMIATLDHMSGGRAGLNIVAGAFAGEFAQMGAWDETLDHDARYDLAEEWTTILKRLWTEPRVDFQGRYFQLRDCVSDPKPLSMPTLLCAGMSKRGLEFSVRAADGCFIGGRDTDETRQASLRARTIARDLGKTIRTYAMVTVILGDTDAQAQARADAYRAGVDRQAVQGMLESYGVTGNAMTERAQDAFMTHAVIGTPDSCAKQIADFLHDGLLDGLMFIFDDYPKGLAMTGRHILPALGALCP
jgi:pyrimidine oxygenase